MSRNKGMSQDMYNFIVENLNRLQYNLEEGLVITPKGTNGTFCNSTGYLRVKVNKRLLQVHQILAVIYFGEECIDMQINHKDGNKLNNKKENLEAVTQNENIKHEHETGLVKTNKPIDQLDMNGNYIKTFSSIKEATKAVGLKNANAISYALKGKRKRKDKYYNVNQAGGYKWRYSKVAK